MRKLKTSDAFKVMQIAKTAGIKDGLAQLVELAMSRDVEKIGAHAFALVFDLLGCDRTEGLLYILLGDIAGKTPEEVRDQPIEETITLLKSIAKENDLGLFFRQAVPTT